MGTHKAASFLMSGNIENLGQKAAIDFQMVSQSVPLDEDLFNACSPQIKKIWFAFAPSGTIGIDYHFQSSSDRQQQLTMTLQFNSVSAVYQPFPYALDNLKGTVLVTPDGIEIKQLFSDQHAGGTVNINGLVEDLKSNTPYFQLDIQGRNIPIDQGFINAIPPNRREFCSRIEIDAQADFDMQIPRQQFAGGIPQFNTDLRVNGKKLLMKDFCLPMTDFQLVAHATADELTLHQFTAKAGGGSVSGSGQLTAGQANLAYNSVCLDINVDNVQFDDAFWQSLESKKFSFGSFRLGGPLNAKGHIQLGSSDDHCSNTQWSVECLGNTVLWADRPLGQARGKVTINKDAFVFDEFVLYVFQLEQLPEDLLNKVFPSFAKGKFDGGACISLNHGIIRSEEADAFSADLDGVLTLNAVSCGPLKQISDLTGMVRGRFKGVLGKEQIQIQELEADYELERLCYEKCELTQLRGPIAFDRTANLLQSSGFTGASYGGSLNGSWSVDLHSVPLSYYVSGSFNSLDISRLIAGPQKEEETGGLASGSFELKGVAQAKDSPNGTLTLKVSDMRLGKQSLMGKLLTAIQLKQPRAYIFNELQVDALVHARTLICKRVRIAGDPLIFYGSGMLDWERQQINLELVGIDRVFGNDDTIMNMLARGFGSAIWKIEVKGDLKEPAVDAVYLSVLKQPLEVFKSEGSI